MSGCEALISRIMLLTTVTVSLQGFGFDPFNWM
jgi:hypothetical protein